MDDKYEIDITNREAIDRLRKRLKRLFIIVIPLVFVFAMIGLICNLETSKTDLWLPLVITFTSLCFVFVIIFIALKVKYILTFKKTFKTNNKKALNKFLWLVGMSRFGIKSSWINKLLASVTESDD